MCYSTLQFLNFLGIGPAGNLSNVGSLEDTPCCVRKPVLQSRGKVGNKLLPCSFKSHICTFQWMLTEGVLVVHLSQMRPITIIKKVRRETSQKQALQLCFM